MDHSTSERVAAAFADAMEAGAISLRTLASETGIPLATLSRSLAGHRSLRMDEVDKIAAALGLSTAVVVSPVDLPDPYTQPHGGAA